jgi:hypothetical protein
MDDILFVFGSARGGTTYLSKVLTDWFSYGMGPEGTFVQEILKRAEKHGDLSLDDNCYALARDIIATQTFQIIQTRWGEKEGFSVHPEDIVKRMPDRTTSSAIFAAFKVMADRLQLERVGNKNPGYWRELDILNDLFPLNAKYLFIVRDGRDVALSLNHVPWGGHSAYAAGIIWKNMIETVNEFEKNVRPGALLKIRYEDLLDRPGDTIEAIGTFIGQDDLAPIRAGYEEEVKNNQLRSNFGKWVTEMSAGEQQVYEAVAGDVLSALGYRRLYPQAKLGLAKKMAYRSAEFLRKIRLNIYHLQSHLPQDTRKSKKSKIIELVKPGDRNKPN